MTRSRSTAAVSLDTAHTWYAIKQEKYVPWSDVKSWSCNGNGTCITIAMLQDDEEDSSETKTNNAEKNGIHDRWREADSAVVQIDDWIYDTKEGNAVSIIDQFIEYSSVKQLAEAAEAETTESTESTESTETKETTSVKKSEAEWKKSLTDAEYDVLRKKGTEKSGTGALNKFYPKPGEGHFACRGCSSPLYSVQAKFDSGCGWPAFDKCYANSVRTEVDDSLGVHRVEILCNACDGHLGHVFEGEKFTATNERHCVNSISLKFVKGCQPDNVKEEALCSKLK